MDYGNMINEDDFNSWKREKDELLQNFENGNITEDELLTELTSLCYNYFPIKGYSKKDGESIYLSIASYEANKLNINPISVLTNPRIITEFQVNSYLEECFENKGSLYSDENINDRTSYSNTSYKDSYALNADKHKITIKQDVSNEDATERIFVCSDSDARGLSHNAVYDIFGAKSILYHNSKDASCVSSVIPMTHEQMFVFAASTEYNGKRYYTGSDYVEIKTDDFLYVIENYKNELLLHGGPGNISDDVGKTFVSSALKQIGIDNEYCVDDMFHFCENLYGCEYDPSEPDESYCFDISRALSNDSNLQYTHVNVEKYDPETGLYYVKVDLYHENEKLTDEAFTIFKILNDTTGFYDKDNYLIYQKNHLDEKVAAMTDDMFSIKGIKYSSSVTSDDLAGFNVSANAYLYSDKNDSGIFNYKDYAVYVSGDLGEQSTILNNTLEKGVFSFNDFGFYASVAIDQADSELSKMGFESIKSFNDKVYVASSDSYTDVNYYGVYLKNGQYCLIPRDDTYNISDIEDYVSNSYAMKNYKLYEALLKYYNNAEEVDVKYSSYAKKYSVYINGELIELSEEDAKYILSNGISSLTVSKFDLPKTKSSKISNGSSYVYNKFHRNCISLNDTTTYEKFVNFLRNDFSLSIKKAKSSYDIANRLSPYISSTGNVISNKNNSLKTLSFLDKDSENLCLQIEKCLSLLTMYDASLKNMLNSLIDNFFEESALRLNENNDFTSSLIDKDPDFINTFLSKEATAAKEAYLTLEAYKDGCIVLSSTDLEKYADYIDKKDAKLLDSENPYCDTYSIPIASIKNVGDVFEWAIEREQSGNSNSLTNAINLAYSSVSSVDGLNALLSQTETYRNYYNYTSEFAKDILSDQFTKYLVNLNDSGISSDYLSNSELALFLCKSGLSFDKLKSLVNNTNKKTDFSSLDSVSNLFGVDFIDSYLNDVSDAFSGSQYEILNKITNNSFKERIGYVGALKMSDFLLNADDSTFEQILKNVVSFDIGFDNGLLSVPTGLWHLYDPSLTSKEYFMSYVKDFLNPVDENTLDNSYKNGTMSLKEYNFRKTVIDERMQNRSNTLRTVLNVGNDVGAVTGNTLLALVSVACPALSPFVSAVQVASNAGYKAQAYYLQSGGTTSDAWKARLYGVINASASYLTSRFLCSAGSSYTRFDAHGNALFGKGADNYSSFLQNYATQRGKQLGAGFLSDNLLMGVDYLFNTDITYKNSLVGSILSADSDYVGKYSNNFWLDYALSSGVDLCLDMMSDYSVSSFQKKFDAKRRGNQVEDEYSNEDDEYWKRISEIEDKLFSDDLSSEAAEKSGYVLGPDGNIIGDNVPDGVKHLYSIVGSDISSIYKNDDGTYTVITKYGYKIKCSEAGLDSQNIEFEISYANEIHESMVKTVGEKLYSWIPDDEKSMALYNNLMLACENADFSDDSLEKSLRVLDYMERYYADAKNLKDSFFDTYRTHGVVHIMDVMTQCINGYEAFEAAGIDGMSLDTITLSGSTHDTGMSGGRQIRLENVDGFLHINSSEAVDDNGAAIRESHSFNSGGNLLLDYKYLMEDGKYTDLQIVEAALLSFAHSKSNSGLMPLSDNDAGWSFAIQALDNSLPDDIRSEFSVAGVLQKYGIISLTDEYKEVTVKCPKVENPDGTKSGGTMSGKINVYDFNDAKWLETMEYESLIVRLGDAATNNDHAGTNQKGQAITFKTTDFSKQTSIADICTEKNLDLTSSTFFADVLEETNKTKIGDGLISLAISETKEVTYEIAGVVTSKSQQFVLGEDNQTYRITNGLRIDENGNKVWNGDKNVVEFVVSVKNSDAVPFCTLYSIDERLGELNSKGGSLFRNGSGKELKMVIEIDRNSSDEIKHLYSNYAEYVSGSDGKVSVEVRYK